MALLRSKKQNGITEELITPGNLGETHYIPYDPVIWDDKTNTKIRIIFDTSARASGSSLNDCFYKRPHLTPTVAQYPIKTLLACCYIDSGYRESI